MKEIKRIAQIAMFAGLLLGLAGVLRSEVSAQGAQDFLLVNKTGIEIYSLYVTPHDSDDWGDDILGADTLAANEDLEITFSRKEKAKLWDLRIEDSSGNYIEWDNINLLKVSEVTLYYKNKKPTATFK